MRIIVYGAGGVGGTIGARLHMNGVDVVLIVRGTHLSAIRERGLKFVAPDGEFKLDVPVAGHPSEVDWRSGDVVMLTVKSQHTADALNALAGSATHHLPVVCAQNGVANERMALRQFENVYGMVVNLPALHLEAGVVVTHAAGTGGILDVGRFPHGSGESDDVAQSLAEVLTNTGFSSIADRAIMRKKYAKLLQNLGNALQAATTSQRPGDLSAKYREDLAEVGRHIRQEALECYAAAGIDCATREEVRDRHANSFHMVDLPGHPRVGGSSWQSVSRGTGNIETDFLNGEICLLGGLHQVPTPANRVCQQLAREMTRDSLPVGSYTPGQVLQRIHQLATPLRR